MRENKLTMENELLLLHNNMFNFAYRLTENRSDAEDLIQETILRVLTNLDKYYSDLNFKGWVLTIMHNIFVNNYKRSLRNYTIMDHTDSLYYLNMSQTSGIEADQAYTVSEIYRAINRFAPEYRKPFEMFLSGYNYNEIAESMGVPLGTVKSRIFFIRKRLKESLKDYK